MLALIFSPSMHRLPGGLDLDLELGLLVLLDPETAAAVVFGMWMLLDAEHGVLGQRQLAGDAAVGVGGEGLLEDLFAACGLWICTVNVLPAKSDASGWSYLAWRTQNLNWTLCSGR